jgi:hypothetical protein
MLNNLPLTPPIQTDCRPHVEVADILRLYGDAYREQYPVSPEQRLVMRDIVQCRTAALGGHVDECDSCGGLRISYNSCRNRHCPKCGALMKAEWLERQKACLLPTHYFHVVFTIDHAFNPLIRVNQQAMYDLLFHSAASTLQAFGRKHLGGEIGCTVILHTWGQTLVEHPHLHCLVPGGALSADGQRWQSTLPTFLFPIEALSAQFRDRFCDGLWRLYRCGRLRFAGESLAYAEEASFSALVSAARGKAWQVYAKPPFAEAAQVLEYLGRYVHRVAISNHRIAAVAEGQVRFRYRDYKADGQEKEMMLPAVEFIRRFLQHVLPKGYVRIRHYGLLASRWRADKLACCRRLLGSYDTTVTTPRARETILAEMLGHDPQQCPSCGVGRLRPYQELLPHPTRRRWVAVVS